MNCDRIQPVERFAERVESLSGGGVPNLYSAVGRGGEQPLAIRSERQVIDRVDVIFKRADFFSAADIPKLDQLVIAGSSQQLSIGRERDAVDAIDVALDRADHSAFLDVPDLDFPFPGRKSTGCCEQDAIRRKCNCANLLRMTGE